MANLNRVLVIGNLTRDPELRYTPSGTAVVDLGLAVNESRKVNDEWVEETTFLDVTVWGRQAETVSEYQSKGSTVMVEGRLKMDTWEKDGQKHSKIKVVAERVQFLGAKGAGGRKQEETAVAAGSGRKASEEEETIPF